ncbi:helix-turn-helix transcriptional regulator, partial [Acinetobacter baumannii]|nr:helix-turn-helix transcriptional regulator [Acinetobacter baumannii]
RKELGMTQQDLADKCGLSKNTIYNYENGRVEPTKENIEKISKVLSVDTLDLVLENKPILPKDKNFDGVIALMQAKLLDLIEDIISKNLKVK